MVAAYGYSFNTFKIPKIGVQTIFATLYFLLGVFFKSIPLKRNWRVGCLLLLIVGVVSNLKGIEVGVFTRGITIFPAFILAVAGIVAVLMLLPYVTGRAARLLDFCGQHTLTILTFHFLVFKLVSGVLYLCGVLRWEQLAEFPFPHDGAWYMWIVYTLSALVALCTLSAKLKIKN